MKNQKYQQRMGKRSFWKLNPVSLFIAFLVMVLVLLYVNHFKMSAGQEHETEPDRVLIEIPAEKDEG